MQGQHHHRIDRPNRLSLVVENAHLANDDLAFAVKRIQAQDFERFLRQGEAQRIEVSGTLVQHHQAGIVGAHREVRAPEDLRPAPPLGLELDFEHASTRLEQPGARHRHGHQWDNDQADEHYDAEPPGPPALLAWKIGRGITHRCGSPGSLESGSDCSTDPGRSRLPSGDASRRGPRGPDAGRQSWPIRDDRAAPTA